MVYEEGFLAGHILSGLENMQFLALCRVNFQP